MKNNFRIILIITAVFVILAITACDILIAPAKGRNNPYDVKNPVPAARNFIVTLDSSDPNGRSATATWEDGQTDGESYISGYIIIYKALSAPQTIFDGTVLAQKSFSEENSYWSGYIDEDGSDYPVGNRVYYSIFSYGTPDDLSQEEQLFPHDGQIDNYQNYEFTGPVSASIVVTDSKYFYVESDGYITDTNNWFMDQDNIYMESNAMAATTLGFITFDLESIRGAKVMNASMALTTYDAQTGTMSLNIGLMNFYWGTENWTNLNDVNAVDSNYTISVSGAEIPDTGPERFEIDITGLTSAWCSSIRSNHGIRMKYETAMAGLEYYKFQSNEHSGDKPEIQVTYYYE